MDSMRSLNTSLPRPHTRQPEPPEQLLQAFKSAALSVTNLYKTSVTDQTNSRQSGYQDALEDLLGFLDREDLGLQDGEGWMIRQWATERSERVNTGQQQTESDDDRVETEKQGRSSSPVRARQGNYETAGVRDQSRSQSPVRTDSPPPTLETPQDIDLPERPQMFRFTAGQNATEPTDTSMQTSPDSHPSPQPQRNETGDARPIRVEVVNRGSRTTHRHTTSRHNVRGATREFNITSGTKRKLQFPDFFDISNLGNGRDMANGGGKRSRMV